jgi:hypothetical protein
VNFADFSNHLNIKPEYNPYSLQKSNDTFKNDITNFMEELSQDDQVLEIDKLMNTSLDKLKKLVTTNPHTTSEKPEILAKISALVHTMLRDINHNKSSLLKQKILDIFEEATISHPELDRIKRLLSH